MEGEGAVRGGVRDSLGVGGALEEVGVELRLRHVTPVFLDQLLYAQLPPASDNEKRKCYHLLFVMIHQCCRIRIRSISFRFRNNASQRYAS